MLEERKARYEMALKSALEEGVRAREFSDKILVGTSDADVAELTGIAERKYRHRETLEDFRTKVSAYVIGGLLVKLLHGVDITDQGEDWISYDTGGCIVNAVDKTYLDGRSDLMWFAEALVLARKLWPGRTLIVD